MEIEPNKFKLLDRATPNLEGSHLKNRGWIFASSKPYILQPKPSSKTRNDRNQQKSNPQRSSRPTPSRMLTDWAQNGVHFCIRGKLEEQESHTNSNQYNWVPIADAKAATGYESVNWIKINLVAKKTIEIKMVVKGSRSSEGDFAIDRDLQVVDVVTATIQLSNARWLWRNCGKNLSPPLRRPDFNCHGFVTNYSSSLTSGTRRESKVPA